MDKAQDPAPDGAPAPVDPPAPAGAEGVPPRGGFWRDLPPNTVGALWILAAAFLFTVMAALIKLAGERLSVFQILLVRQSVMILVVAPVILRGLPGSLYTKRPSLQALRVICAATAMICGFTAVIHMPLADATAISFSKTFFITVFAILFLGETVGRHRWAATIVGFLGVLLMLRPQGDGFVDIYAVLALVGAAGAGMVMIILRILTRTDQPSTILTYQALFVGLIALGPALYLWIPPTPQEWALLIVTGLVSWAGQMCNIRAFRAGEATAIASLDYTRLLYATAIGIVVFGDWPASVTLAGAALIIAASLYTVRREALRGRALARAPEGRGYNT
ncbi:DMT family transporter [Polymorphum gilvum]|uniref:Integral membrane protein n=1 Tax=Polymorphum gilvum (strain LMG 25793 / CGMCC 1.9160 / SL003B-26A1) TaxID=991905 RepID=F2J382_POLGS|nr:DMT family transporter [Polymorphum gilvum]ADZ69889.1 Integral membrane protein [Polymorphum gilvum SL003B-26A1]